jgi:hypothetical protein
MSIPSFIEFKPEVAHMYFEAAANSLAQASSFRDLIRDRPGSLGWLRYGEAYDWGDEIDPDEEMFEAIDEAQSQVVEAFGRYVQGVAIAFVLSAMCLEAHVNAVASTHLSGRELEAFDKLSIEGKWLLLPRMAKNSSFDPGAQPFQGFSQLIRRRNALVHAKGSGLLRALDSVESANAFLDSGLKDAQRALDTTKTMIGSLGRLLSEDEPSWLEAEGAKFYDLIVRGPDREQPT